MGPILTSADHEAMAERLQHQPGGEACHGAGGFPWLATAGFSYLTLSSGMALHRSRGDPGAAAFAAFAYLDLALLFCCLRTHERAEPGSPRRDRLKLAVWLLTAALTLLFSYKVAAVMPPAVAALVWAMGLATLAGGFAALFCFKTRQETDADKTLLRARAQSSSSPPPSFLALDPKQISGGPRWPSPSLDLSSLNAHTPIEP